MATKTNSANGTSNRPNATEMRDWYEKNKHSLEMYANAKSNNDMYLALRAGFQNGYINLLMSDISIDEHLSKFRGYGKLWANHKA